ncbi:MAG: AraC family transcriptional regulator [Eubacteriales bacterium]|nr:AraC family transcriptional regulator [Eubacteriales bacterium]
MLIQPNFEEIKSLFWRKPKLISVNMEDPVHTKMLRALHVHDDRVEIILIRSGNGVHTIDGKAYSTHGGNILIYNAGVTHDECADQFEGMQIISCAVSNISIPGQADNTLLPERCSPLISNTPYFQEIEALLVTLMTVTDEEIEYHLTCALLLLVRQEAMKEPLPEKNKTIQLGHLVQQYLDAHYLEDIQLEDVAAQMNMSPYYLTRVFRRTVGYPPKQYLVRRRIGEAQSWLLMTDLPVTDIAMKVGYNSVSNFHNTFRRIVGMTPQQYRDYWKNK